MKAHACSLAEVYYGWSFVVKAVNIVNKTLRLTASEEKCQLSMAYVGREPPSWHDHSNIAVVQLKTGLA